MSNNVKNMIDAIKQGNYSTAQSEFKSAIAQKVSSTFENKKIEIASQMTEGTAINERKSRQMVDPDKEVMVVKNGNVEVIDKKDLDKYMKKGYELAEGTQSDSENGLYENKNLMKDYQDLKDKGKKDSDAIEILMVMPKYRKMSRDQISKIIGDEKRKGVFKR